MNQSTHNKIRLLRSGAKKEGNKQIIIGGADLSDLPSKQALLDQKVEEAITNVQENADEIIRNAEIEAKKIIEEAETNSQNIRDQAQEAGYADGYEAGRKQNEEEMANYLKESANILEAIKTEREECIHDEQLRVYKIITEIAKHIFKKEFSLNQDLSLDYIKKCISKLEHKATVNLLVNPDFALKLNGLKDSLIKACPGLENIIITACPTMQLGDLIVESNKEKLDYRLGTVFDEILEESFKKQ